MNNLKKIYDVEVTPPEGAWNRIEGELDSLKENKTIAKRMLAAEQTPPAIVWNNIAEVLDEIDHNKSWATNIYNAETPPPSIAWENIEKQLDDQKALEIIEKKLSAIQIAPPAAAWTNILHKLENRKKEPALVVPFNQKWLRVAAAACFLTIISTTAFFILKDNKSNQPYTASSNTATKGVSVKNIVSTNTPIQKSNEQQVLAGIRTKLGNAYSTSSERNADLQNRYIILMTQDGNIVRMSKKLSNMADCIAGEDHSCDDQISKWQKEMASSNAAASPDNFLDILDMASTDVADGGATPNM